VRPVEVAAGRFHKLRLQTTEQRAELDDMIFRAKNSGATYKELAEAAGLSVAWVQSSLLRSGYKTAPRAPASTH
jgi:cyanate lyase